VVRDRCVDSQSIKKIKGRERHTLVDTLGLLMAVVVVTAANVGDRASITGSATLLLFDQS
jgi:hypothetical protein